MYNFIKKEGGIENALNILDTLGPSDPSRRKKNPSSLDPIKKIMKASNRVQKNRLVENEKLIRILERMELDKPILMHDKLEIIWDGQSDDDSGN